MTEYQILQVTLPSFVRKPEQTFLLAAFLKVLLLTSTFPSHVVFKPFGEPR